MSICGVSQHTHQAETLYSIKQRALGVTQMQTLQSELKLQVSYVGLLSEAPNRQYVTQATWYRFNLAKSEINPMAS